MTTFAGVKRPRKKTPPRQVWILVTDTGGLCDAVFRRKKDADEVCARLNTPRIACTYLVAGPFILAERVRQK